LAFGRTVFPALAVMLTPLILQAQSQRPAGPVGLGSGPATALASPEVHADRTVTFRLRAPDVTQVELVGEITQGKGPQAMTKDDAGIWSITIGPLAPEIYVYNFRIQGVDILDPSNFYYKPTSPGLGMSSFAEVPGDTPAFYDSRPVPHGEVRMVMYESKAMGVTRWMWIYTPPGYDKATANYPVFYLLHGNGEAQNGWVMNGRANIILDNLIADHKAQPMIVVMPHGHALQSAGVGPAQKVQQQGGGMMNFLLFTKELLEEIIPMVEKNYRVYADADHRAIGGLSMGGMQAISIGLSHLDLFHYVLGYSGGFGGMGPNAAAARPEAQSPWKDLLANAADTKKKLHLLFLGSGRQEGMIGSGQQLVKVFKEQGINAQWADHEGGHVWSVWRNHLNESVPLLFAPPK
jgi:enterochelin esterase family protein